MKTISSRNQYLNDQIACIIDSLIFGHLQRKQYSRTLHALLSESPHLSRDATTVANAPNQIILNVNGFLHDQNLEQIIESFYTYGRFDVSPNLLELGKKLRELTNEFSSELAFGCHSYANNAQRLYGRKLRTRTQQNPTMANQMHFDYQFSNGKRVDYVDQEVPHSVNEPTHNNAELQYSQRMESDERAEDASSHEIAHHSRRKAAQPLKQTQIVMQSNSVTQLVKMSNEVMRDKEADVDNSSFLIDPYLGAGNFNDILNSVVDDDTLYETLESVEREEAMADQNSRDSMNESGRGFSLDIPMHDEVPPSSSHLSPHPHHPIPLPPLHRNSISMPPPPAPSHYVPSGDISANHQAPPLMDQYIEHSSTMNSMDNRAYNSCAPGVSPLPHPPNLFAFESQTKITTEAEKKPSRVADAWAKNGAPPSQPKTPLPPPPHTPSHALPPSSSSTFGIAPKLCSLGRIPKKGQSSGSSGIIPSPSASPREFFSIAESSKCLEGFRISKGKTAPMINGKDGRKDSMDSQETLRAESVGESDCTMTENEDNDHHPVRKEPIKSEKKSSWDDLFDDGPSTMDESNKEREKQKDQENKRRLEMRELEKKKEREKRRKEKEKKDDERRDRSRDDKNRYDKRSVEDRRRESGRDEKEEKEKEKEDRQRKRREQEQQKKIIEEQKKQMENEERARQKKKEEEERKRELREKEKELKKEEDEKIRKEREKKAKEERRNELERRRRKEAQQKNKCPILLGDSPLDKIAAEMDGKEMRKENDLETTTRASSRVMEISSGLERNRSSSIIGSLHSSKSGIFLDKAQKLRGDTTTRQPQPLEIRRTVPIRPNRIQMAPKKRSPPSKKSDEDSEDDDDAEKSPVQKKGKLEDTKIDHILNKLYR